MHASITADAITDDWIRELRGDADEEMRRAARFALSSMFENRRDLARRRIAELLNVRLDAEDISDRRWNTLMPWVQDLAGKLAADPKIKHLCDLSLRVVDDRGAQSVYGENGIVNTRLARLFLLTTFKRDDAKETDARCAKRDVRWDNKKEAAICKGCGKTLAPKGIASHVRAAKRRAQEVRP